MTKKQAILAGLAAAGIALAGVLGTAPGAQDPEGSPPAESPPDGQEKAAPEEMSWDEWQAYAQVLDHEIKKNGGIHLQNSKVGDILPAIEQAAKNRTETKDVQIDGETYSKDEYKQLKDGLMEKARRSEVK